MFKKSPDELAEPILKPSDRVSGPVFPFDLEETRLAIHEHTEVGEPIDVLINRFRPIFEEVRRTILRETFIEQLRRKEMPGRIAQPEADERQPLIFTETDVDAFVECGDGEGLLSSTLFDEVLVPQVRAGTHDAPSQFSRRMNIAIHCLPLLAALDTSGGTHARTNPQVYSSFFRKGGSFETFMTRFGAEGAVAAAAFQGGGEYLWDETANEPLEDSALITAITPSLELLDEALYPLFFAALREQSRRSRKYGEEFLARTPDLLAQLKAKNDSFISLWLTLAATGSRSYHKELFELNLCVPDMEAIAAWGVQQPGALEFFLFYLRDVYPHGGAGNIRFAKNRSEFASHCPPEIIEDLMQAGYTKERITEVLSLFKTIKEMEPIHVLAFIRLHPQLEKNYPGGIEALRAYAAQIASCPSGISRLISTCATGKLPTDHLDEYLETGVDAVRVLKNAASSYFSRHLDHVQLLETDTPKFKVRMQRIIKLADRLRHLRSFLSSHPRTNLFRAGLCYLFFSDEKFDAFCGGAEKVIAGFTETTAEAGDRYNDLLIDYLHPEHVFFDSNEYPQGDKRRTFEDQIDWNFHAEQLLLYHEDSKAKSLYRIAASARRRHAFISGSQLAHQLHHARTPESQFDDLLQWTERAMALRKDMEKHRNADIPRSEVFRLRQVWIQQYDALFEELGTLPHHELVIPERVEELRGQIDDLIHALLFRGFICGILEPEIQVKSSDFLRAAHAGTQVAVMGGTLLYALGLLKDPLINREFGPMALPFQGRALLDASRPMVADDLIDGAFGRELRRRIAVVAPRVEGQILAERFSIGGAAYVGGKGHAKSAIPTGRLNNVRELFGLEDGTPFSLMHHNSVRLPPSPTALEMSYMVQLFALLGIPFDSLQVCATGHWPEEVCRLVAATYLLGTSDCPSYASGAFATTHNGETGHRLIVRGAGVVDRTVPFFLSGIPEQEDRTDVLGRVGTDDFALDQWVGTLVPHALYGGRFAVEGREWLEKMHDLMSGHGLMDDLENTIWVVQHATGGIDSADHHADVIRRFTDLWRLEVVKSGFGLVGEVQSLLGKGAAAIRSQREAVQVEDPEDFMRMMRW